MQKIITGLFLLIITFSAYSQDNIPAGLNGYITNLVNETSATLNNSNLSQEAKITKARALLRENLDLNVMASDVLGPYSYYNKRPSDKKLTKAQQEQFTKIYSEYVIKSYTDLIKEYKGQKPENINIRPAGSKRFIVSMSINQQEQNSIKVEYLVREIAENVFKVSNIITENVSLIDGQRDEFTNTLKNQGFDQLMQNLKNHS